MSGVTEKSREDREGDVQMSDSEGAVVEPQARRESAADDDDDGEGDEEEEELDREKVKILPEATTEDGTCASFQILNEDHTLGNALRYVIMKNPEVEFCGYSIPHPSENWLNVRIQTYGKITAVDAFKKGLGDLMDMCDVVEDVFTQRIREM